MKHWKSWFLVLGMLWTARAQAQETLVSDENMIAPFEGLISYKITYSGVQRGMKSDLPDSMTVMVRAPHVVIHYFGGLADTLLHKVLWSQADETLMLMDPAHEIAYVVREGYKKPKPRKQNSSSRATLLGHPCKSAIVTTGGTRDQVWFNDSIYFPLPEPDTAAGVRPPFFQAGLRGLPLKHVRTQKGVVTTAVATSITSQSMKDEHFRLPGGYTRKEFEPRVIRHPVIGDLRR